MEATNDNAKFAKDAELGNLPRWNLGDLFPGPDSSEFQDCLNKIQEFCEQFTVNYRNKITKLDAGQLATCIQEFETIATLTAKTMSFVNLHYATNTLDPQRSKLKGDVLAKVTQWRSPLAFFSVEINDLDADKLESLTDENDYLAHYRPFLRLVRKHKPHQLSAVLEHYASDISSASYASILRLYRETTTSLRFKVAGNALNLTETLDCMTSPKRKVRRSASKALSKGLGSQLSLFSLVMNTVVKENAISDRWRQFSSPEASRHLDNDVESEVVDALIQSVSDSYEDIPHRYYKLKAKWLGLKRLKEWDRLAPLPDAPKTTIPWLEAQDIVLDSFGDFSSKVEELTRPFFTERWIDAAVQRSKLSGAFCASVSVDAHPYVLLNYLGRPRDVMTLAHELGHGVHQRLAASNGELMAHTPLTLAETASVFGETLTFNRLLRSSSSEQEKRVLLAERVEDMINTMFRQVAFHSFESQVHQHHRKHGELTSDQFCDHWVKAKQDCLGPAFSFSDGFRNHWAYVQHFVEVPFYVYSYAFGLALSLALYAEYEKGTADFVPKYLDMLVAGGTKHHSDLLEPFGISISNPAFWSAGLSVISSYIDDLEAIET